VTTVDYLGDLTDGLEFVSGSFIDQFISGGPNNYAFSVIFFRPVNVLLNVK